MTDVMYLVKDSRFSRLVNMGYGGSLGDRVVAARDRAFVGRAVERALFRSVLAGGPGGASVVHLGGPGGVGEAALVRRVGPPARGGGGRVGGGGRGPRVRA